MRTTRIDGCANFRKTKKTPLNVANRPNPILRSYKIIKIGKNFGFFFWGFVRTDNRTTKSIYENCSKSLSETHTHKHCCNANHVHICIGRNTLARESLPLYVTEMCTTEKNRETHKHMRERKTKRKTRTTERKRECLCVREIKIEWMRVKRKRKKEQRC